MRNSVLTVTAIDLLGSIVGIPDAKGFGVVVEWTQPARFVEESVVVAWANLVR